MSDLCFDVSGSGPVLLVFLEEADGGCRGTGLLGIARLHNLALTG
ncbi:hypothetical protein [Streptomyces sp. NPDC056188]